MALIYNVAFNSQTRVLSLSDRAGNVISSCEVPSKGNELTLKATGNISYVILNKYGTLSNTYEVNTGSGWTAYTFGTAIFLKRGERCRWRCSAHPTTQSDYDYVRFEMYGAIEASGNVNSTARIRIASTACMTRCLAGYIRIRATSRLPQSSILGRRAL